MWLVPSARWWPFGFLAMAFSIRVFSSATGGAAPQRLLKVYFLLAEQAEAQLAVGGEAESVALVAEVLRDRRDKADGAFGAGQAEVFGRPVADFYLAGLQLAQGLDALSHLADGNELAETASYRR